MFLNNFAETAQDQAESRRGRPVRAQEVRALGRQDLVETRLRISQTQPARAGHRQASRVRDVRRPIPAPAGNLPSVPHVAQHPPAAHRSLRLLHL